jgi:LacI family transcriptional regulator/LacI family repressor for deo operon, udp, cdd, tsx, nupC, and nupG
MRVDDERARLLSAARLPHVCLGPPPTACDSPSVAVDGREATIIAMRHLLGLGHRRIGLIQLPSEFVDSEPQYLGYGEALAEAGLQADPQLIVEAGRQEDDGYLAMQELLNTAAPPTAVLACSDELAFGAMHALYDARLVVGHDVSLVGFDDVLLAAHTHPPLTALHQPRRSIGERAALLLIDLIERRLRAPRNQTVRARLIVRHSTGPPKNDGPVLVG